MDEISITGTTAEAIEQLMQNGGEQVVEFVKESFLQSAIYALFKARRTAGLTQADIAKRMHTRQPAITRYENDTDGGISLRHYLEFALACGVVPCDITLVPLEQMVKHISHDATAPRTSATTIAWTSILDNDVAAKITTQPLTFHADPIGQQSLQTVPQKAHHATLSTQGAA